MASFNNFLLNTDVLTYKNDSSLTATVPVGGATTIPASTAVLFEGSGTVNGNVPEFTGFVSWQGGTTTPAAGGYYSLGGYFTISAANGALSDGSTGVGYDMRPRVKISGSTVTLVVEVTNPYGLVLTIPAYVFTFSVKTYEPPMILFT